MNDWNVLQAPEVASALIQDTRDLGYIVGSDQLVGGLLRVLAASKPQGQLLELGTGTGYASAWMLDGMNADARLVTVEQNETYTQVARKHLGADSRIEFVVADASEFVKTLNEHSFDLIFADCPIGKWHSIDSVLKALRPGGFYVVDDMLPHTYAVERQPMQQALVHSLTSRPDMVISSMNWSSGILIATKKH